MNEKDFPAGSYRQQLEELNKTLLERKRRKDLISIARLSAVVLIFLAVYSLHDISMGLTIIIAMLLLAVFTRLVIIATNISQTIANLQKLVQINQAELEIHAGKYTQFSTGSAWQPAVHGYANDLDILGHASVYQYVNRTQSQQGNERFARWLLTPASADVVLARQEAIKELAPQFSWRQQLQAHGKAQPISAATEEKVKQWLQNSNHFIHHSGWKILRVAYPVVALTLTVLFAVDILPGKWAPLCYVVAIAISGYLTKLVLPEYNMLNKIVPEVEALFQSARHVEQQQFRSAYLQKCQQQFAAGTEPASLAIHRLKNILDKFDYNLNFVFLLIVNPLLLWNLQLIFSLEHWRTKHKSHAAAWFSALAEMESIASLANMHFNHPSWVFPILEQEQAGVFSANELGHPLLPESRMVKNSFSTAGLAQVSLITGSNMAGKSTFLRSAGVNIILAMAGAPVCASAMRLSPMRVISSMRVADNLEESTSTFYAELKKLKSIIESVNRQEKVFVLLDEILRGTNSLDRHTGTEALIKQLIRRQAVAMLATHDVALAGLSDEYGENIHNYHFDAQISGEELYFDYRLKEGVCKSINASLLMKKIGIEL